MGNINASLRNDITKHLGRLNDISVEIAASYLKYRKKIDMDRLLSALLSYEKKIYLKEHKIAKYTRKIPELLTKLPSNIADHLKTFTMKKSSYMIAEPYNIDLNDLRTIVKFCDDNKLIVL